MPSSHGFIDQRLDPSGLLYYNARYYDPSAGQFTSADDVQGANRYAYVVDNPLTLTDPSGTWPWDNVVKAVTQAVKAVIPVVAAVANAALGISDMINDVKTVFDPSKSWQDKFGAVVNLAFNAAMDITTVIGVGEGIKGAYLGAKALLKAGGKAAAEEVEHVAEGEAAKLAEEGGNGLKDLAKGCNSFQGDTPVATPTGAQAIATLQVGDQVTAYDNKTGKAQPETVQHVFINHDDNLLDVTIANTSTAKPVAATDPKTKQHEAAGRSPRQPSIPDARNTAHDHGAPVPHHRS